MKKYRFLLPIISVTLVLVLFVGTLISLYVSPDSFSITFNNRDGLFDGISVEFEVFDSDDKYSLISTVEAGNTVHPKFTYGDRYYDHYSYNYHYDRYLRGESPVMAGYSFKVPEDEQKIAAEGGDSYSSTVTYPDGTTETKIYREPYYEVKRVYISRSLYIGEPLYAKRIYESEPMLLEAAEGLEIFVGGRSGDEPFEPTYIVLRTKDSSTRISRTSEGLTYWSDAEGNVFFLDCLENTYFKESTIHGFKKIGDGEGDYEYKKIADVTLDSGRKILDYRAYGNTSLIVSEDKAGVKYITTCDHATGELHNVYSYKNDAVENIQIDYSNGVACVRFATTEYFTYMQGEKARYTMDVAYFAIDLSSHTLCAKGEIEDLVTENVYGNSFYESEDDMMDILWRDGRLYVIDAGCMHTTSPTDISSIPVISAMDKNGAILMGYRFLSAKLPENGGQNIIVRFSN